MIKRTATALALLLVTNACNRTPATNNAAANAAAPAPVQTNAVIAPPMAPPAMGSANGTAQSVAAEAQAEGCAGEIGARAADQLVLQCRDVSPATHPPCNTSNSCAMIREEIARGCGMLGGDAPDYCPPAG